MKQTFEIPKGCSRVTIEQRGDEIIIDFKFDSQKDLLFTNEAADMMDSFKHLIPIIKKWREEKQNNILKPEFKEGDILVKKYKHGFSEGMEYIFILDNIDLDGLIYYKACYSKKSKSVTIRNDYGIGSIKDGLHLELRYATESEKQLLFNAIAKEGEQWNAEKKCIEDLKPERWRAEEGVYYWYLDSRITTNVDTESGSYYDELRHLQGNYFQTKKQACDAADKIKELLKQINP